MRGTWCVDRCRWRSWGKWRTRSNGERARFRDVHALCVAQLTMQARDVVERPRWRLRFAGELPRPGLRGASEFGHRVLDFARQLRGAALKFRFERRQSRL